MVVRPPLERPIHSWVRLLFLRQHCVDGPEQSCCRSGHTRCLPRQPALQRPVAKHHACSSACGEYESPKSRQSVRADRARECLRDNDRALPRQRGDYPWQSLRGFRLCWGASAQYVATDHHGEHSVWWSWDFSSIGKGKRVFPPRRMMCLKRSSVYLMTGPIICNSTGPDFIQKNIYTQAGFEWNIFQLIWL